jgi:hypothetical protein
VNGYEIDSRLAILVWLLLLNKIILLICLCEELNSASYHSRDLAILLVLDNYVEALVLSLAYRLTYYPIHDLFLSYTMPC